MKQTSCPKSGIKIYETQNRSKLSKPVSFQNTTLNTLDLDLENYSLDDLYNLFNITENELTEDSLRNAKQIVLKMHPDKSRLDSKYFIFFSNAYKRLYGIYEFQNKSTNKRQNNEDYFDESNKRLLDNMFDKNKAFKDPKNFNDMFNKAFEKHRLEDPNEHGYGDWLKSNDGFISIGENITKGNMNDAFEQKKKQMQAVSIYKGITDNITSSLGGSLLDGIGDLSTESYTDLRQAYTETLIPVTQDDYNKMEKFNSVSEYKAHREKVNITPISKEEGERKLHQTQKNNEKQSAALAFKYAKEAEKMKEKQNGFWSDLKQITGW
jgi:hypothetical protein